MLAFNKNIDSVAAAQAQGTVISLLKFTEAFSEFVKLQQLNLHFVLKPTHLWSLEPSYTYS